MKNWQFFGAPHAGRWVWERSAPADSDREPVEAPKIRGRRPLQVRP